MSVKPITNNSPACTIKSNREFNATTQNVLKYTDMAIAPMLMD